MDCFDEIGGLYTENFCKRCNRQETNVHLTTLQRSDRIAMEVRKLGKAFLREAVFFPNLAQLFTKRN